jgi:hypothetical protein
VKRDVSAVIEFCTVLCQIKHRVQQVWHFGAAQGCTAACQALYCVVLCCAELKKGRSGKQVLHNYVLLHAQHSTDRHNLQRKHHSQEGA